MTCRFNKSIHITYRCDRIQNRWIYVHGNSKDFYHCYPPCSEQERSLLLNKYFTKTQQSSFRIVRLINDSSAIRFRCFNNQTRRWNRVIYQCGQLSFNQSQLSRLSSCFQGKERNELPGRYSIVDDSFIELILILIISGYRIDGCKKYSYTLFITSSWWKFV